MPTVRCLLLFLAKRRPDQPRPRAGFPHTRRMRPSPLHLRSPTRYWLVETCASNTNLHRNLQFGHFLDQPSPGVLKRRMSKCRSVL
ncbi:unnamed protein product [Leptidea sinapis]|uniref:Uncharacterized protein n=1 Tax=Leptidea sinapis TaxID=189913 RepID=A0A5E4QBB6_9NEOP|nr:unnamed protein product [Leptidea sinapis]